MNIFSKLAIASVASLFAFASFAAAPKLMIVPDKTWCKEKGYIITHERNGKVVEREDYDKALVDKDFVNVQLAMAAIMAERGYPVVSAASQQESDDEDEMLDEAFEGAQSGAGVQTSAYDELLKRAKPDITLKIGWNINVGGSLYNADWRIDAVDTYSNKQIAPVAGNTGDVRRSVPLSVALKQTAKNHMDDFCEKLNSYFDDVEANGREITCDVRIVDNGAGVTMTTEFGGIELSEILDNWMNDNTLNHQYTIRSSGRNMKRYDQVRIPLKDSNGRAFDANGFVRNLQKYLKTFGLQAENATAGLGRGRLYIGEK